MGVYQKTIKLLLFFLLPSSLFCENSGFLLIQANKPPLSVTKEKEDSTSASKKEKSQKNKMLATEADNQEESKKIDPQRHLVYSDLSLEQMAFLTDALKGAIDRLSVSLIGAGEIFQNQNFTKEEIDLLIRYREATLASYLFLSSPTIQKTEKEDLAKEKKEEDASVSEAVAETANGKEEKKRGSINPPQLEGEETALPEESGFSTTDEKESSIEPVLSDAEKEAKRIELFKQLIKPEEELQVLALLARAENQEFSSFFNESTFMAVVESIQIEKKESLNQFYQLIIRIELVLHSFELKKGEPLGKEESLGKNIQIVLSGFQKSPEKAFSQALSFLPKQLMREISSYLVEKGESAVVEILDNNEVVLSLGSKEGVFVGKSFSLLTKKKGKTGSLGVKGQLKAYKVEEDYCYCELLFLDSGEEILVGDRVEPDSFVGLETQIIVGFMGSLLASSDYKNIGLHLFEGESQAPEHAGFFSENVGYIGIREVVNYGMNLIRPFFGLDLFLDGAKGSGSSRWNPEKVWLLGSVENEGFLYRRDFMGMVRPYVGFNLNWFLNRVTISPEMAIGFILGNRLDFNAEPNSPYGVASRTDYAPIVGSAFQYFTFTSLLNLEVRIDPRFSFLFHAGYDGWLGNMFELKGKIKPSKVGATPEEAVAITGNDFLKYFDWQFFRIGVGFSVRY